MSVRENTASSQAVDDHAYACYTHACSLQPNQDTIARSLEILASQIPRECEADGSTTARLDIYAIAPNGGMLECETIDLSDAQQRRDACAWIARRNRQQNIYVMLNEADEAQPTRRFREAEIKYIRAAYVDKDLDKTGGREGVQAALDVWQESDMPPTAVMESGGGIWGIHFLDKKILVTGEVRELARGLNQTLQRTVSGDSTFDLSRLVRCPGTINWPSDAKRRDKGQLPREARFIEGSSWRRYPFSVLVETAGVSSIPVAAIDRPTNVVTDMDWRLVEATLLTAELPPDLRARFAKACESDNELAALWKAGTPAKGQTDTSGSGNSFQLAVSLKEHGSAFSATDFGCLLAHFKHRSDDEKFNQRYAERAWTRAQPRRVVTADGFVEPTDTDVGQILEPFEKFEPSDLPPRPWVARNILCRNVVSMVAGPGGVSKSTYSLMLALGIATGRSDLACFEVKERAKVGIFNAEDDLTEVKRRLLACMIAHNVSWDDLRGPDGQSMLRVSSGVLKPLQLAYRTPGDTMRVSKATRQLADEVRAQELAALILDPFQEMHDAPENDNAAMKVATSAARDIAVNANVAVLLVAHTRKPSAASSEGFAGDIDSLRGASSQIGVIRVGATFFTASAKDEKTWHMPDGHRKYVRLDIAKNNLGPLTDEPKWFRRGSVKLGNFENADEIGILRPVTLERKVREAQTNVLQSVAQAIKDHLKPDTMYRLAEIIDHLPVEDQAVLRDKNRARSLNEAFGGPAVNDFVCEYGVLKRVTVGGNVGTTFSLSRVPHSASNTR